MLSYSDWVQRLLVCLALFALPIPAQTTDQPLKIGSVTVQGSFRTRLEMWDWFDTGDAGQYAFSGNQLRLNFSQRKKRFDWFFELEAPFLLALPEDAVQPVPQGQLALGGTYYAANSRNRFAGMLFPKQGYLRFKNLFGDTRQSLRVGRFEFSDGAETTPANATLAWLKRERVSQRLIGPFGWSHVGRSFDGIHYVADTKKANVTFVGALPTRGAFQVDGWGNLNVGFGYLSLNGGFNRGKNAGDWRLFGIYYQDWRRIVKTDNRSAAARNADLANIRIGAFGGHYLHTVETSAGDLDFTLWGVLETGKWGRLDHRALAGIAEAGWQPNFAPRLKPWLRAGYSHTSGDSNPNDNRHETFFQFLPTPRPYARTPFFDMINNNDLSASLLLRPHRSITLRSEFHSLSLAQANDQWVLGGGAFQPWTFGYVGRPSGGAQSLANLWDINADWTINPHYSATLYYSRSPSKSVIRNIYPGATSANFAYVELNYKF